MTYRHPTFEQWCAGTPIETCTLNAPVQPMSATVTTENGVRVAVYRLNSNRKKAIILGSDANARGLYAALIHNIAP